jgi:predicted nucleic acid-binding protein
MAVLVDSSLWVHQLRRSGDPDKRARVEALLQAGSACWCPPVRLELWRGVATDADRKALRRYEALLPSHPITPEVWERAIGLADQGRAAGVTIPLADLLVFACARVHDLDLAHADGHFDALAKLDLPVPG